MANQVLVHVKTSKGTWETTFQKSTRIKDVILGSRMHFRLPKETKLVLCRQELPHVDFDPDRALVNYNIIDGEILDSKGIVIGIKYFECNLELWHKHMFY